MKKYKIACAVSTLFLIVLACDLNTLFTKTSANPPHEERWGIYSMNLETQEVELFYSTPYEIINMQFSHAANRFAFSQKIDGNTLDDGEIFSMGADGSDLQRLTTNHFLDTYPIWSPDGSQIAYLAWPDSTLDIFMMAADGSQANLFYDSSFHDADIDWKNDVIAFTRNSQIWLIHSDGSGLRQLTDPPRAGVWGIANLPFGDYDPRISPDGSKIIFERMVDDISPHGNYDLFSINMDGSNLEKITDTGFSQGLANWSPSGIQIVYIVSAIDDVGKYDMYLINSDGTNNRNITPATFPEEFLVHWVGFSEKDTLLYFVGDWWAAE